MTFRRVADVRRQRRSLPGEGWSVPIPRGCDGGEMTVVGRGSDRQLRARATRVNAAEDTSDTAGRSRSTRDATIFERQRK